jgi:hypothetical protein
VRRETAWEEGTWKRVLLFGWLKALKAKSQERCRGETDPVGDRLGLRADSLKAYKRYERVLVGLGNPTATAAFRFMR